MGTIGKGYFEADAKSKAVEMIPREHLSSSFLIARQQVIFSLTGH